METKTLTVEIQPGVTDANEINFYGEGHLADNSLPGDLIVKVKI
jgi:DnaJ-class molecular chaperone